MSIIRYILFLPLCLTGFYCSARNNVSTTGLLLSTKYDKQWPFSEGLSRVMRNVNFNGHNIHLYGFVDKMGQEVVPLKYDYAEDFSCGIALVGNLTKAKYNADNVSLVLQPRYTYITKSGKELDYSFYFASSANKQRKSVLLGNPFIPYGLHNTRRLDRVKWQYKEVPIKDLILYSGNQENLDVPKSLLNWGNAVDNASSYTNTYNLKEKFIGGKEFYSFNKPFPGIESAVDLKGNEQVLEKCNDKYSIICQHGLCGVRDSITGKLIIPCAFGDLVYLGKDKFAVEYNKKWAILDDKMMFLTDFVFDKIQPTGRNEANSEHWVLTGTIKEKYTYEWGYEYTFKWISLDIEKIEYKN